jgi:nitrogen fixation protein NifU and related proteins
MHHLNDLYQAVILDHNRRPRNFVELPTANRVALGDNPLCGDHFTVYVRLEDGVIREVAFQGAGCAISKASASLMTLAVKGKTLKEAQRLFEEFHHLVTTGEVDEANLSDLSALAGVHQFPARIKCATLSWHALLNALEDRQAPARTE